MDRKKLQEEFDRIVSTIKSDKKYERVINDFESELKELRDKKKPANIKHHHNGDYGLLEHTIEVCKILEYIADMYYLNKILLLTAGLLHDIGKLDEYTICCGEPTKIANRNINHTQYVYSILRYNGHYLLADIIGTHMGKKEWGAIQDIDDTALSYSWALHLADMMSAKIGE